MKQIQVIIDPNGQVQNMTDKQQTLHIDKNTIQVQIEDIATYTIGATTSYKRKQIQNTGEIQTGQNHTLRYVPQQLDSVISGNTIRNQQVIINNQIAIDLKQGLGSTTKIIANTRDYK
ncbi:MAG: hypothetical protein WCJ39_01005 [bacterium]